MGTNNPYSFNDNDNKESSGGFKLNESSVADAGLNLKETSTFGTGMSMNSDPGVSSYNLNGEEKSYYDPDIYGAGTVKGLAGFAADKARENTAVVSSLFCMCVALIISGIAAFATAIMASTPGAWMAIVFPCFILEFVVFFFANWALKKRHATLGTIGFVAYSIVSGITLSCVFVAYDLGNIVTVFLICAIMFAGMAIFGLVTKIDLRPMASFFAMSLIGLLVMILVNWFVGSAAIDNLIGAVGVVLFAGITAYDIQRIRDLGSVSEGENMLTIGMYGGLMLYLDFLNLFLKLLRLFGRSRD